MPCPRQAPALHGSFHGACSRAGQPQQAAPRQAPPLLGQTQVLRRSWWGRRWQRRRGVTPVLLVAKFTLPTSTSVLCRHLLTSSRLWTVYKKHHINAPDKEYQWNKRRWRKQRKMVLDKRAVGAFWPKGRPASVCRMRFASLPSMCVVQRLSG